MKETEQEKETRIAIEITKYLVGKFEEEELYLHQILAHLLQQFVCAAIHNDVSSEELDNYYNNGKKIILRLKKMERDNECK